MQLNILNNQLPSSQFLLAWVCFERDLKCFARDLDVYIFWNCFIKKKPSKIVSMSDLNQT